MPHFKIIDHLLLQFAELIFTFIGIYSRAIRVIQVPHRQTLQSLSVLVTHSKS